MAMTDRDSMQMRAIELMRDALSLLDRIGADIAAVHVQWAMDILNEARIPKKSRQSTRKRH